MLSSHMRWCLLPTHTSGLQQMVSGAIVKPISHCTAWPSHKAQAGRLCQQGVPEVKPQMQATCRPQGT